MKILVLGATGFIGSAVVARLLKDGHQVIALARRKQSEHARGVQIIRSDIRTFKTPEQWHPLLNGTDAVVNCAGALQSRPGERIEDVHASAVERLFAACEQNGIRRVIHFSAAGAERGASEFSRTKLKGDAALMAKDLDWFILRPSIVVGQAAYGGSALLRGLAGLPVLALPSRAGPLQLVHLDDVVETVAACLRPDTPPRQVLEPVGPQRFSFPEAVQLFRQWLGWRKQPLIRVPNWAAAILFGMGDALRWLGWRPPISSNAQHELVHGAIGDPSAWMQATRIKPRNVEAEFQPGAASVQERWFSRLYFLKGAVIGVFGCFWLATGVVSLGPGWEYGLETMRDAQVSDSIGRLAVVSGGLADLFTGAAILYRPTTRIGLLAALLVTLTYLVIGTALLPDLWNEPLGPMLKVFPILVLNFVALAVLEDR